MAQIPANSKDNFKIRRLDAHLSRGSPVNLVGRQQGNVVVSARVENLVDNCQVRHDLAPTGGKDGLAPGAKVN